MAAPGTIIEIFAGHHSTLLLVTGQKGGKLTTINAEGNSKKIDPKKVTIHHIANVTDNLSPVADANTQKLKSLESQILALTTEVDSEFLWEALQDDLKTTSVAELCELFFSSKTSAHQSAILRIISADTTRFKVKGTNVTPRSTDQVALLKKEKAALKERADFEKQASMWLESIEILSLRQKPTTIIPIPDELRKVVLWAEDFLYRKGADTFLSILPDSLKEIPSKEIAFQLLRATGRIPLDANRFLAIAGLRESFSSTAESEAESLLHRDQKQFTHPAESGMTDLTENLCFSIDDESTREIDDALTVSFAADGHVKVGIHIALLAYFIKPATKLDKEAFSRSISVYLPGTTRTMLPETLSCQLASLNRGEIRPVMSFNLTLDSEGKILNHSVSESLIRVSHRLTYEEADYILAQNSDNDDRNDSNNPNGHKKHPLHQSLTFLALFAKKQEEKREARGAVTLRKPELKISLVKSEESNQTSPQIALAIRDRESVSQRIVSESMILANNLAAIYAKESGIPFIFRTQSKPDIIEEQPKVYDPILVENFFRTMKPGAFSPFAKEHWGLGLNCYTQCTSPLRRYADLVIQRQLSAAIQGRELPYNLAEITHILGSSDVTEKESRGIESRANRYYILNFLKSHEMGRTFQATIIKEGRRGGYSIEIDTWFLRGQFPSTVEYEPGDQLTVTIAHVEPDKGQLSFKLA